MIEALLKAGYGVSIDPNCIHGYFWSLTDNECLYDNDLTSGSADTYEECLSAILKYIKEEIPESPFNKIYTKTDELFDIYLKDIKLVAIEGAKKYGDTSWLNPDPKTCGMTKKNQVKCFASHAAEMYAGKTEDDVSGLYPTLHIAWRSMAIYIRHKEDID